LSKSTTKADFCGNENRSLASGDDGGVRLFSTVTENIVGAGGVGTRGSGVSVGGVIIGIALSSAVIGIALSSAVVGISLSSAVLGMGDPCRLIVLISCTSYDRYGLILDGYGSTLSLITSSTDKKKHYI
jgi:hypothetical protein